MFFESRTPRTEVENQPSHPRESQHRLDVTLSFDPVSRIVRSGKRVDLVPYLPEHGAPIC